MRISGLSITEIVVVLAISALLIAVAVPSYRALTISNQLSSTINLFVATLALARTQAVNNTQRVAICASSNGQQCNTEQYEQGWIVFVDHNQNNSREGFAETLIWVQEALPAAFSLRATAAYKSVVAMTPSGRLARGISGNITLCFEREPYISRKIILIPSGRMRVVSHAIKSCNL